LSNVTTVTVDKDTWLNGNNTTQQNGTDRSQSIGAYYVLGSFYKYNGIFSFDVSGITDPSTITKANLRLPYNRSTGTTTQTVTLARLNQDFVENEATYLISETAVSWSGGSGGFGNAETTQPTYTFDVGSGVSANVTIDIKDLVVDAIVKRSGTLLLIASVAGTPTGSASGYTSFQTQDAPASNGASISITQAERIVWSGATNGNMSTDSNWVGGTKPDANDYAMFIENGVNNPSQGAVICERIYFGKLFSQDAGVEGTSLALQATSILVDTQAQFYPYAVADEVIIRNTKDTIDGCNIRGTISNLYIANCNSTITVDSLAVISNIYIMSGNRINPASNTSTGIVSQVIIEEGADDSNILCEGRFNVTDNAEGGNLSLYGGGKYELNNTSEVDGIENLIIASGSVCYFNAKEIQTALTMYGGTFTIEKNTNAQLDMPTTITNTLGEMKLNNGLESVNGTALSGTTFTISGGSILLGKEITVALSG